LSKIGIHPKSLDQYFSAKNDFPGVHGLKRNRMGSANEKKSSGAFLILAKSNDAFRMSSNRLCLRRAISQTRRDGLEKFFCLKACRS